MPAHRHTLAAVLVLAAGFGMTAAAQAQDAPRAIDQTGTGGGPTSTVTAPNTTSLGVTKPPGGAGVAINGRSAELLSEREKREKEKNDRIARSICRGC